MSLSGSIGGAIGDVIQGANMGLAVRRANDALDERDYWKAHAANLQEQLRVIAADRQTLRSQLADANQTVKMLQQRSDSDGAWINKLRNRLAQCNKSLMHSSATSAGLVHITTILMAEIKRTAEKPLNDEDNRVLQAEFEAAWNEFLTSGRVSEAPAAARIVASSGARVPEDVTPNENIAATDIQPPPRVFG